MIKIDIREYIRLGEEIRGSQSIFWFLEQDDEEAGKKVVSPLSEEDKEQLVENLTELRNKCSELGLSVSKSLLSSAIDDPPQTEREFLLLRRALRAELRRELFVFVPSHRKRYFEYDRIISEKAADAFPSSYQELRSAGNAYAAALYTSCVFHSMRAAEIGLRTMGEALGVSFDFPIALADWQNIIDKIEAKIKEMQSLPKGGEKDEKIKFYSQAAVQFRYFKDAWRIRVSHARETYEEQQALSILRHTREFLEYLAQRLKEGEPGFNPSGEPLKPPAGPQEQPA